MYLLNTAVVFGVYARARVVPPWALGLLCLSKRVHSLFVLRLFNDCVAMLLAYCSVLVLQRRCWRSGLLLFSAAVSIKMNVLLFAPALLLLLCKATSLLNVLASLAIAAALQLGLAVPFLRANAWGYLSRSFDLGASPPLAASVSSFRSHVARVGTRCRPGTRPRRIGAWRGASALSAAADGGGNLLPRARVHLLLVREPQVSARDVVPLQAVGACCPPLRPPSASTSLLPPFKR